MFIHQKDFFFFKKKEKRKKKKKNAEADKSGGVAWGCDFWQLRACL
jgi:hypothetical protein